MYRDYFFILSAIHVYINMVGYLAVTYIHYGNMAAIGGGEEMHYAVVVLDVNLFDSDAVRKALV